MLVQPRSKVVPISIRFFKDALVVEVRHKEPVYLSDAFRVGGRTCREVRTGEKILYELIAEGEYEERLLSADARSKRTPNGGATLYRWRFPVRSHGPGHNQPDVVRDSLLSEGGVGSLIKGPLQGALAGLGLVLVAYALINPNGAQLMAKEAARWAAGEALASLRYPRDWGDLLFTPGWESVLRGVVGDLVGSIQNDPRPSRPDKPLG